MTNSKVPLVWRTERRVVDELVPNDNNPRTLSSKQLAELKKSLKRFNLVEIPAIDMNNRVIAGHQRLKVLQLLERGQEEIDVRVPNRPLTDTEYDQYLLTSNTVSGDWDFEKLKAFDVDFLLDVGFDADELNSVWAEHLKVDEEDFDEEKELAKIKEPKTKPGDLIQLGNHRLICGDCTDASVLQRLCGSEQPAMIYSDPPYNINLDYDKGIGGKQSYGGHVDDALIYSEYALFLGESLSVALDVSSEDLHVFYWCDQTYIGLLQHLYRDFYLVNKRVCLWIKNGQNPTPGVAFNKCYEPCVYGVRGKPYLAGAFQTFNEVMNHGVGTGNELLEAMDSLDVWAVKRLSGKDYEHPTSKPPELHEKAIRRCTKPGDIILDSFGGSGSTLIATEGLKRRAFLVEREPVFCDVIIKRFEKQTGIKAQYLDREKTSGTTKVSG